MIKTILVLIMLVLNVGVQAQTLNSKRDNLGYTHTTGKTSGGENVRGLSKTDSLGYTNSQWSIGNERKHCFSKTDSLGYTNTRCW